jgi:hypothetical protein
MVRCNEIPERTCRYCGKKFVLASHHSLKDSYGFYCKPTCYLHRHELKKTKYKKVEAWKDGELVEVFSSPTVAAHALGTEPKRITAACREGTTYRGYTFKYKE